VLRYVALRVAVRVALSCVTLHVMMLAAIFCGMLQCVSLCVTMWVVVCCDVLHAVLLDLDAAPAIAGIFAMRCSDLRSDCSVLQCVAVYCIVLRCIAVCCSVLQCVAVSNRVLQCVPSVL